MKSNQQQSEITVIGIGVSDTNQDALKEFVNFLPSGIKNIAILIVELGISSKKCFTSGLTFPETDFVIIQAEEGLKVATNTIYVAPPGEAIQLVNQCIALSKAVNSGQNPHLGFQSSISILFKSLAKEKGRKAIGILLSDTCIDIADGAAALKAAGGHILTQLPETAYFPRVTLKAKENGQNDFVLTPATMGSKIQELLAAGAIPAPVPLNIYGDGGFVTDLELLSSVRATVPLDCGQSTGQSQSSVQELELELNVAQRKIEALAAELKTKELELRVHKQKVLPADNLVDGPNIVSPGHKAKEAAVAPSEENYRRIFINNPQCMWLYDPDTLRFIEVNDAALSKYGYSREEFGQINLVDIRPPEDVDLFLKLNQLDRTEETVFHNIVRHRKKNGDFFYVEVTSQAVDYAGKKVRLVLASDISSKIEAEQLFIESNDEISAILESITDGFYTLDANWNVTYWNHEVERMFGLEKEKVLGKNLWKVFGEIIPRKFYGEYHRAIEQKVSVQFQEYFAALNLWVEVSAYPSEKGLSVYMKDVTEHKRITEIERLGKEVLEMNALPEKLLEEIITHYLRGFEKIYPGMFCSFERLENGKLYSVAAPSLPEAFTKAMEGAVIADEACSCCAAAHLKQKVVISDIQAGSLAWAAIALNVGIRAAWSYPLIGLSKNVIGVLTMYYGEVKEPSQEEEKSIESARNIVQVIYENKLAQIALRQSNERFNYATAASNDAIYDWNIQTDHLYWGAGFEKIFGYKRTAANADLTFWLSMLHADDFKNIINSLTKALEDKTKDDWKESYRCVRSDESIIYVVERSYIIRDNDGKAIRMVGALQDVTEQKVAEEELRKLSIIAKETVNAVVITSAAGETLWVNDAFTKITEYSLEDMLGKKPGAILQGEGSDPGTIAFIHEQLKKQVAFESELINYTKKGRKYWIRLQIQPLYDDKGNVDRFFALQTDITKAKEEEQQLRLLESVITNSTDAVVITKAVKGDKGHGLEVIYINESFTSMTGYTLEDVKGKDPGFLNGPATNSDDLAALRAAIEGFETIETEILSYTKSGETYWSQLALIPIADTKGNHTHWISIQRNITSRRKYEEERELMIQELTQRNNDLRQFSFITSHNLRAPLSNLISITNLLKPEAIPDARSKLLVQKFKESTFQLNNTINDLLEILVIKNNSHVKMETLSLNYAFAQVVESVAGLLSEHGGTVETDFSERDAVYLNSGYLHSILLNLLTNGIKYRSPARRLEIRLKTKVTENGLELHFSDNGLGINLERYGDRIFGLYQRFHNHPDSKGMGLYITHSQIKAMGGQIEVQSEVDKGTTFIIHLKAT